MARFESESKGPRWIGMPPTGEVSTTFLEIKRINEAVTAINVETLMPRDWQRQIRETVRNHGKLVTLPGGKVSTSLEKPDFTTVYTVVTGQQIEENLPWLWKLYGGTFSELTSEVAGSEVVVDPHKKFGANINTISRDTQRDGYELHVDINHWTALLAVTDVNVGDGGELIHVLPSGEQREARVKKGWLYIFDGKNHPHKVNLLNPNGNPDADPRITVPMDYVYKGWHQPRPAEMDAIFGNGHEQSV